jgi:hypothetical protein
MHPSSLALDDLDVPFISAFFADLETKWDQGPYTQLAPALNPPRPAAIHRTDREFKTPLGPSQ